MAIKITYDYKIPAKSYVGLGTCIPIKGYISNNDFEIESIYLKYLDKLEALNEINEARIDQSGLNSLSFCGFYHLFKIPKELIEEARIGLDLIFNYRNGTSEEIPITELILESNPNINQINTINKKDAIAICMATYQTDLTQFERQIDSIILQSHQNWILLINDDASDADLFQQMVDITAKDNRIQIRQNQQNVGFYKNFEACLYRVGSSFQYVALADQDDYWKPNKLAKLIDKIKEGHALVYGDLQVKNQDGNVIQASFKDSRGNHFKNLEHLAAINTVSGASCLFQSSLLKFILPFPFQVNGLLHDQWISVLAASINSIGFVNEVLQDYYQHESNVLGFSSIKKASIIDGLNQLKNYMYYARLMHQNTFEQETIAYLEKYESFYLENYLRLNFLQEALSLRLRDIGHKTISLYQSKTTKQQYLKRFVKNYMSNYHSNNIAMHLYISMSLKQKLTDI